MTEEFNASLVREKIIFVDDAAAESGEGAAGPTVIKSNRIFLKLGERAATEKVVVRAQNMHTTLRLAGKILFSYYRGGLLLDRTSPSDWETLWDQVLSTYEKEFNPNIWASIYINGKSVFKTQTSPFVDIIEKCALLTIDNYDATMDVTESALKQIGRAVRINHSSNVAAVLTDTGDHTRCGIIHRADGHDTTFTFNAEGGERHNRVVQSISMAAAFLEAINLQFVVKNLQLKLKRGEIAKVSKEANQLRVGTARLVALDKGIASFEEIYAVKYRPEKPQFFNTV
jgi:hypothetical protein